MTPPFLARFAQRPHLAGDVLDIIEDAMASLREGPCLPWSILPRAMRVRERRDDVTTRIETRIRAGTVNLASRAEQNGVTRDIALHVPRRRGGIVTVAFHALDEDAWLPRRRGSIEQAEDFLRIAMKAIRIALDEPVLDHLLPAMASRQLELREPGPGPYGDREILFATPFCPPLAMQDMRRAAGTLDPIDAPPCLTVRLQINEYHRTIITLDPVVANPSGTAIEIMRSLSRLDAFMERWRPTAGHPDGDRP